MPYDLDNPPEKLRGLPQNKQRQWIHVYQSCMGKYGEENRCQKMSWGTTHGWKKEKGFDPLDPDRDILLEMEVLDKLEEKDWSDELAKNFGDSLHETITDKELENLVLSSEIGIDVEVEDAEKE